MERLGSFLRDDRLVIGALCAVTAVGAVGIYSLLEQWRADAVVIPPQPKTQYITQDTEDSLKPATLESLLDHYNYAVRDVASKIIIDRAINDEHVVDVLLWGITRPDYDVRLKNLRCLAIVTDIRRFPLSVPSRRVRIEMLIFDRPPRQAQPAP